MSVSHPSRSSRSRLHLRIAVATGVPFAILWGSWTALTSGEIRGGVSLAVLVVSSLVGGVIFGTLMSVVLGTAQWRAARATAEGRGDGVLDARTRAIRTVTLALPASGILDRGADAAALLGRAKVARVDHATGVIMIRVGVSWQSWGELVRIAMPPDSAGPTLVTITSAPIVGWTLVDYGRNARNVERLAGWLRELSGA